MNQIQCHKCKQPYDRDTQWATCPHNPLSLGAEDRPEPITEGFVFERRSSSSGIENVKVLTQAQCNRALSEEEGVGMERVPLRKFRTTVVFEAETTLSLDGLAEVIIEKMVDAGFTIRKPISVEEAQPLETQPADMKTVIATLQTPHPESHIPLSVQNERLCTAVVKMEEDISALKKEIEWFKNRNRQLAAETTDLAERNLRQATSMKLQTETIKGLREKIQNAMHCLTAL